MPWVSWVSSPINHVHSAYSSAKHFFGGRCRGLCGELWEAVKGGSSCTELYRLVLLMPLSAHLDTNINSWCSKTPRQIPVPPQLCRLQCLHPLIDTRHHLDHGPGWTSETSRFRMLRVTITLSINPGWGTLRTCSGTGLQIK